MRIKQIREDKGISQTDLANKLKIGQHFLDMKAENLNQIRKC